MKGMRVNMTFAFSGAGTALEIVVCVCGLTEGELPGTDFLHLEVPGLCIGGGANIANNTIGHVLFMRNTERAKQRKFKWYQDKIFIPGVNANRLEFDEVDVSTVSEIAVEDTAVVSVDGNIPQLKAVIEELDTYEQARIIFNKLTATASTVEQGCDCCPIFKSIKTELPHHTVRNLPASRCPIKRKINAAFKSNRLCGLKLSHTKREALIDFIAVFPGILSKVCTPSNIQSGFIKNGMIDAESLRYPSFDGMFSTCKSNPTIEAYSNIRSQMGDIVLQYDRHGEADEDFLDGCRIRRDIGPRGDEILRNANSLHLRRATIINHKCIVEKRELEPQQNCDAKRGKMHNENEMHPEKVAANREAVYKVSKAAEDDGLWGECPCLSDENNL